LSTFMAKRVTRGEAARIAKNVQQAEVLDDVAQQVVAQVEPKARNAEKDAKRSEAGIKRHIDKLKKQIKSLEAKSDRTKREDKKLDRLHIALTETKESLQRLRDAEAELLKTVKEAAKAQLAKEKVDRAEMRKAMTLQKLMANPADAKMCYTKIAPYGMGTGLKKTGRQLLKEAVWLNLMKNSSGSKKPEDELKKGTYYTRNDLQLSPEGRVVFRSRSDKARIRLARATEGAYKGFFEKIKESPRSRSAGKGGKPSASQKAAKPSASQKAAKPSASQKAAKPSAAGQRLPRELLRLLTSQGFK
jgi:hypothetical protein